MAESRYECRKIDLDFFNNAPIVIVSEVDLPCSPETLFRCFEDGEAWSVWVDVIKAVEWTSPRPFQVGTTRNVEMPGGMIAYEEFLAWDEPRHMAFRFNQFSQKFLKAFGEDYKVTDLGNERCRLAWTVAMEPGMPMRLMTPFLRFFLGRNLQNIMHSLRDYMETDGRKFRVPESDVA